MVLDLSISQMAYRCGVPRLRQCESDHTESRLERIGVVRLDEVFKYLSRHRIESMTGYGKCCGRLIVAQNWLHCPFCGGALLGGQPVKLRTRIADAEQTTMTDHLDRLDVNKPTMNWSMKRLRALATMNQLVGRSKLTKAQLVEQLRSLQNNNEPLHDF